MNYLLIKNAYIIDPDNNIDNKLDVLISNGKIKTIDRDIVVNKSAFSLKIVDASNYIVVPGLIDAHVHFRDPGEEQKEDIPSGSKAAAAGGFTSVICEPNTKPRIDNPEIVKKVIKKGRKAGIVNLYTSACITKGDKHDSLVNVRSIKSAGAVALTDDGDPVVSPDLMLKALVEAKKYDIIVSPHCESSNWALKKEKTKFKKKGEAELFYVKRDIELAQSVGAPIHIQHVSLEKSLSMIRKAKKQGLRITCEVTPHHLILDESAKEIYETIAKVNPSLRKISDVKALREGLSDGTIDIIASDHAPHTAADKNKPWEKAASGIIGLESTLGLMLTELVHKKVISLKDLITKLTCKPADIFGLPAGNLAPGMPADITVIDLNKEWELDASKFESKSRNCPFNEWKLRGKAVMTVVNGEIKMSTISQSS